MNGSRKRIANKGRSSTLFSSLLTCAIIAILLIAGPASAWNVSLQNFSNDEPLKGESITVKFNLKLQDEINLGFDKLAVYLDGPESTTCYFDIRGNPLVDNINDICGNMSLRQIPLEDYGYGYGYGYGYEHFTYEGNETALKVSGNMPYELTVNTAPLDFGEYKAHISLFLNGKNPEKYDSNVETFTVVGNIIPNVDLYVKEWYPKGLDYVFVCNATNFVATSYDWYYGDGEKLINITNGDTYHIFDTDGIYTVTCIAYGENGLQANSSLLVKTFDDNPNRNVELSIKEGFPRGNDYVFLCEASGFQEPITYDWNYGDGSFLLDSNHTDTYHIFQNKGDYTVSCTARDAVGNKTDTMIVSAGDLLDDDITPPPQNGSDEINSCYPSSKTMAVSCSRGEIVSDTWNGCRVITCSDGVSDLTARSCDKDGGHELERLFSSGDPMSICFAGTCINSGQGYVKGAQYPICDNQTTPFLHTKVDAHYPLEHNVILTCEGDNFTPTTYDWTFGDGTSITNWTSSRISHTYPSTGVYPISCKARNDEKTRMATNLVTLTTPVQNPDPAFPYYVSVAVGELENNSYHFICHGLGFRPDTYEWFIDGQTYGGNAKSITYEFSEEETTHTVSCTGTIHHPNVYEFNATHYDSYNAYVDNALSASDTIEVKIEENSGSLKTKDNSTLLQGLLSYYQEENNHNDIISGHNGVESQFPVSTDGKIGSAYFYSSDNGEHSRTTVQTGVLDSVQTTSLWANTHGGSGLILGGVVGDQRLIKLDDGRVQVTTSNAQGASTAATTYFPISDNEWHHYVILTAGNVELYVDGKLQQARSDKKKGKGTILNWGGENGATLNATIDELGLWSRALSEEEIAELYNDHAGNTYPFGTGLDIPSICYDSFRYMPSSCNGGIITEDSIDGHGCRIITCENGPNTSTTLSCSKRNPEYPVEYVEQYFEMFRTEQVGSKLDICIGDTCIGTSDDYAKSTDLPFCIE